MVKMVELKELRELIYLNKYAYGNRSRQKIMMPHAACRDGDVG